MENYFTLSEAAERLSVSHEAVRRLCHRGTLEHVRFKGRMLVKRDAPRSAHGNKPARSIPRARLCLPADVEGEALLVLVHSFAIQSGYSTMVAMRGKS